MQYFSINFIIVFISICLIKICIVKNVKQEHFKDKLLAKLLRLLIR